MIIKLSNLLNAKNYSPRTVRNYSSEMRYIFAYYNHKDPNLIDQDDIIAYINFIKQHFGSGYDKCRMVAQACSFFYKNVLRVSFVVPSAFYPRKEHKLPNILSTGEVKHLLKSTANIKHRCLLAMFYGTGIRLQEMVDLKVCEIKADKKELKVIKGKGNKDRITIFPTSLLEELRAYYILHRPATYLFEGKRKGRKMSNTAMQRIVREAMLNAGFEKGRYSAHSLRHSFATHLLDSGTDLHTIKVLLGHTKIETTMVYLHLQECKRAALVSPLDCLQEDDTKD